MLKWPKKIVNYGVYRFRETAVILFPFWGQLAAVYLWTQAHPGTRWLKPLFFDPLWKVVYPAIYPNRPRDAMFRFVCAYNYDFRISKGQTVVQIGASQGEETIRFAEAIGPDGRIIAIEPEDGNFADLQVRVTGLSNVQAVHLGAWHSKDTLRFCVKGPKEHRIRDLGANDVRFHTVNGEPIVINAEYYDVAMVEICVDAVDNILSEQGVDLDVIDYVLIETNGSEFEVLRGMDETLRRTRQLSIRAHVELNGEAISALITPFLNQRGFATRINQEGDVVAIKEISAAAERQQRFTSDEKTPSSEARVRQQVA